MKLEQLATLISVRDFASRNFDNVNFKISTEDLKVLRSKILLMDKIILKSLVCLELDDLAKKANEIISKD